MAPILFFVLICFTPMITPSEADVSALTAEAQAVARSFFKAFGAGDFESIKPLFAPEATYTSMRQSDRGALERKHYDAADWIAIVTPQIRSIPLFTMEILEMTAMEAEFGVSVSVRYRDIAAGDGWRVINEGIDTLNMVRRNGRLLIMQYSAFEFMRPAN